MTDIFELAVKRTQALLPEGYTAYLKNNDFRVWIKKENKSTRIGFNAEPLAKASDAFIERKIAEMLEAINE